MTRSAAFPPARRPLHAPIARAARATGGVRRTNQSRQARRVGVRTAAVRAGVAGGTLFFLHALIPGSLWHPLVWPAVTGATAFWIATNAAPPRRLGRGMFAALVAGSIVGLIGFVGSAVTALVLSRPALDQMAQELGSGDPSLAVELGLAMVAVVAVGVAFAGGAAMIPIRLAHSLRG